MSRFDGKPIDQVKIAFFCLEQSSEAKTSRRVPATSIRVGDYFLFSKLYDYCLKTSGVTEDSVDEFVISYKDSDGDKCDISTDDELNLAAKHTTTSTLYLQVNWKVKAAAPLPTAQRIPEPSSSKSRTPPPPLRFPGRTESETYRLGTLKQNFLEGILKSIQSISNVVLPSSSSSSSSSSRETCAADEAEKLIAEIFSNLDVSCGHGRGARRTTTTTTPSSSNTCNDVDEQQQESPPPPPPPFNGQLSQQKEEAKRALLEEAEQSTVVVHRWHTCDGCNQHPIRGPRFRCNELHDYDLCSQCMTAVPDDSSYTYFRIEGSTLNHPAAAPSRGQGGSRRSSSSHSIFNRGGRSASSSHCGGGGRRSAASRSNNYAAQPLYVPWRSQRGGSCAPAISQLPEMVGVKFGRNSSRPPPTTTTSSQQPSSPPSVAFNRSSAANVSVSNAERVVPTSSSTTSSSKESIQQQQSASSLKRDKDAMGELMAEAIRRSIVDQKRLTAMKEQARQQEEKIVLQEAAIKQAIKQARQQKEKNEVVVLGGSDFVVKSNAEIKMRARQRLEEIAPQSAAVKQFAHEQNKKMMIALLRDENDERGRTTTFEEVSSSLKGRPSMKVQTKEEREGSEEEEIVLITVRDLTGYENRNTIDVKSAPFPLHPTKTKMRDLFQRSALFYGYEIENLKFTIPLATGCVLAPVDSIDPESCFNDLKLLLVNGDAGNIIDCVQRNPGNNAGAVNEQQEDDDDETLGDSMPTLTAVEERNDDDNQVDKFRKLESLPLKCWTSYHIGLGVKKQKGDDSTEDDVELLDEELLHQDEQQDDNDETLGDSMPILTTDDEWDADGIPILTVKEEWNGALEFEQEEEVTTRQQKDDSTENEDEELLDQEWNIVEKNDEILARAALGSALFNSAGDDEDNDYEDNITQSQLQKWGGEIVKLTEMGIVEQYGRQLVVDALERLTAANLGSDEIEDEEVILSKCVDEIMKLD